MLGQEKLCSVGYIADLLKDGYKAAILMGAGISVSAGIPLADRIVLDIENKYPRFVDKAQKRTYPEYMRCLPVGVRNDLIRSYINNPMINLAHLYLGALVSKGYVDRILTTNFAK